jgi:hypothetical protein
MKSFKDWRLFEGYNPLWEQLKSQKLPADDSVKQIVLPKIEKIQEELVNRVKASDIESYRELPPKLRDLYAQTMVACVLEVFYPHQTAPTAAPQPKQKPVSEPSMLPQDEMLPPAK